VSAAAGVIAVRTPNWLGDTVMALPALRALRRALPGARILLAGRWAPLLAGQGVADVLLAYPREAGERRQFNQAMGREGADLAILFPNSFEAALAARRWRARRVLGFDADLRRPLLSDAIPLPRPRRHQVDEYAALVEPLGAEVADPTPAWAARPDAVSERAVDALLREAGLAPGARIVGLHVGAAFGASKLWPPESFARLAARLGGTGLAPLLMGSEADRPTEAAVLGHCAHPVASAVGRDHPALLPALLARLACLVSGDTGVAHLAAAVGTATVTLFGPTDPRLSAPRGAAARAVFLGVPCAPCFLTACPIEHVCLAGIEAEAVEREVRSLAA
jgi:heptosyltransferase-2